MTRKDFALIAAVLRDARIAFPECAACHEDMRMAFAKALADANPAFKRATFLRACDEDAA